MVPIWVQTPVQVLVQEEVVLLKEEEEVKGLEEFHLLTNNNSIQDILNNSTQISNSQPRVITTHLTDSLDISQLHHHLSNNLLTTKLEVQITAFTNSNSLLIISSNELPFSQPMILV